MPDASCSFLMAGGVPVVTAPAEIDVTTAGQLRAMLAESAARGHTMVVDLTGTQFCDSAGVAVLARAHNQALAQGGGLWLVVPASGSVPRIFSLTGLDQLIPHFTSLEQALAQVPEGGSGRGDPDALPGCAAVPSAPAQGRAGEGVRGVRVADSRDGELGQGER